MIILIALLFVIPGVLLLITDDRDFSLIKLERKLKGQASQTRDRTGIMVRLEEIGKGTKKEYEVFRIRQIGFALSGVLLTFVITQTLRANFFSSILFAILAGLLIPVIMDLELTRQIKKYREQIEAEFPAIIEMMTLAIAAGETPMSSMVRITSSAQGALVAEFGQVITQVKAGQPFANVLDEMGRRVKSVMIRRFVDALVTATLRGAPLVEVLTRHAIEARANQRNRVLSAAGKAEISMMIPVVFLILPISILFALWPSLAHLNVFAS